MADAVAAIQDAVRTARESGMPLAILGNGSKRFYGRSTTGEPLNVAGNNGVVSYEPTELVITVRGGTLVSEVDALLAGQGQYLAAEPPRFGGKATIAGTVACNLSGPGRPWWGSIRDHILGVRIVNGRGDHLRYGGTVMKNVAGYDVSRLQAGALGSLGVVTEVTLRVQPSPEHSVTLTWTKDLAASIAAMNDWCAKNLPVSAACWHDGRLSLRLSGEARAIAAIAGKLGGDIDDDGDAFWTSIREYEHPFFAGDDPAWRFSLRPNAPADAADYAFVNWGGAERWLRGDHELASLEAVAAAGRGQVSCFCGGDRDRDVFHSRSPAQRKVHQSLKAAFDPDGIFNRGRMYSWM